MPESGVVCTWGTEPGEIGIPRTVPSFEGSGFAQKIERYIDRQLEKLGRMAKARHDARLARQQARRGEPSST